MKKLKVRFEQDKSLDSVDVVVRASERDSQVDELIENLKRNETVTLMLLDRENCACPIDEKDIVLVSANGKQVNVTAKSGVYTAKQSLQSIEELLGRDFLRVSRFEIVNLKMVLRFDFTIGGTLRIEFKNGMETWASRRYIPQIRERLSGEEGYLC